MEQANFIATNHQSHQCKQVELNKLATAVLRKVQYLHEEEEIHELSEKQLVMS